MADAEAQRLKLRRTIREKVYEDHPIVKKGAALLTSAEEVRAALPAAAQRTTFPKLQRKRHEEYGGMEELTQAMAKVVSDGIAEAGKTDSTSRPALPNEFVARARVATAGFADHPQVKTSIQGTAAPMTQVAFQAYAAKNAEKYKYCRGDEEQMGRRRRRSRGDSSTMKVIFVAKFAAVEGTAQQAQESVKVAWNNVIAKFFEDAMHGCPPEERPFEMNVDIETDPATKKSNFVFTAVVYEGHDPIVEILQEAAEKLFDNEKHAMADDVSAFFRKLNFKVESPVSAVDLLTTPSSIFEVFNECAISADVYVCRQAGKYMLQKVETVAKEARKEEMEQVAKEFAAVVGATGGLLASRGAKLDVTVAQPLQVYSSIVKIVGAAFRRTYMQKVSHDSNSPETVSHLNTTLFEEFSSRVLGLPWGVSGDFLYNWFMALLCGFEKEDQLNVIPPLLSLRGTVQKLSSVRVTSASIDFDAEFQGFDVFKLIPHTISDAKDHVYQQLMAMVREEDEGRDDGPPKKEDVDWRKFIEWAKPVSDTPTHREDYDLFQNMFSGAYFFSRRDMTLCPCQKIVPRLSCASMLLFGPAAAQLRALLLPHFPKVKLSARYQDFAVEKSKGVQESRSESADDSAFGTMNSFELEGKKVQLLCHTSNEASYLPGLSRYSDVVILAVSSDDLRGSLTQESFQGQVLSKVSNADSKIKPMAKQMFIVKVGTEGQVPELKVPDESYWKPTLQKFDVSDEGSATAMLKAAVAATPENKGSGKKANGLDRFDGTLGCGAATILELSGKK